MTDKPKRINVAINPETLEILERTIARDGISLTEAVRRLIGVGDAVTTLSKVDKAQIVALLPDGVEREVLVL